MNLTKKQTMLLIIAAIVGAYLFGSIKSLKEVRSGDYTTLSPDKSKSIQLTEYDDYTSIILAHHTLFTIVFSPIASIDVAKEDLKVTWIEKYSVEIEYPKDAIVTNQSDTELLIDTVRITYTPQ